MIECHLNWGVGDNDPSVYETTIIVVYVNNKKRLLFGTRDKKEFDSYEGSWFQWK